MDDCEGQTKNRKRSADIVFGNTSSTSVEVGKVEVFFGKFEVFLSFRGSDTLEGFVDYLYNDLVDAGIRTFRDDEELRVGEEIGPELMKAIEESKICIPILSKKYASSKWCLWELAHIVECKRSKEQKIIPIFYDVEPYDVRNQTGSYGEAFRQHEERFDEETVQRWKEALKEVGELKGWVLRETTYGEEKKIINNILAFLGEVKYVQKNWEMKKWFTNQGGIFDDGAYGRQIGQLFVSDQDIGKGSNGTIVFIGTYSDRVVAVKRLLKAHHDVAFKEIQNLIESAQHQNIVRFYGEENDRDFVYLALQLCTCSLGDLIQIYSCHSQLAPIALEHKVWLDSVKDIMGDINLWTANLRPSPLLLKLMRDVVSGLVHLHELGIIHRDLKPQNVLINMEETFLCGKLSDMGISKRLDQNMSSLGHQATGSGTSGWKAPEQILRGRQTRALDLFSLGCVLFFCITGGRHPFGDHFERDYNIVKNQVDLSTVEYIPEAVDLFSHLLNPDPKLRPKASQVLYHPLLWVSKKRLSFVLDTSDRVRLEARETNSNLLKALENIKPLTFGAQWNTEMEPAFIAFIGLRGNYKFDSVRDLLRFMRNNLLHYEDLPKKIKEILGPIPEGFDDYFASRFPKLLIEVYKVVGQYCKEEKWFETYFEM